MTKFEIIATLFTIVYGLILTDLFSSLHKLIKARKSVKWNWLPLLVSWYLFLVILKNWWAMAMPTESTTEYNIVSFIAYGHLMVLLYLVVSVVLPDNVPEKGIDLKAYYFKYHRYMWLLMLAIGVVSFSINLVPELIESEPLNIPNMIAFFVFLVLNTLLIISKKYWLHALLIILYTLFVLLEMAQSIWF